MPEDVEAAQSPEPALIDRGTLPDQSPVSELGEPPAWAVSFIKSTSGLLRDAVSVGTGVLGLAGIAYVVGWLSAHAYYSKFGATWLLGELQIASLLGFSWLPLAGVAFFLYTMVSDITQARQPMFNMVAFILRSAWVILAVFTVTVVLIAFEVLPKLSLVLSSLLALMWIIWIASAFVVLAAQRSRWAGRWQVGPSVNLELAFIILFGGLYMVPTLIGWTTGIHDRNATTSSLPHVRLADEVEADLRLILASGDHVYVADLSAKDEHPPIRILHRSEVESISGESTWDHEDSQTVVGDNPSAVPK